MMDETPRHLRIETYFLNEIEHVKNHVFGMLELGLPECERTPRREEWEQLLYSPESQFEVLFSSLARIKPQVGVQMYERLVSMGKEAEAEFRQGDVQAFAFKLQDMVDLGWSKRSQNRARIEN